MPALAAPQLRAKPQAASHRSRRRSPRTFCAGGHRRRRPIPSPWRRPRTRRGPAHRRPEHRDEIRLCADAAARIEVSAHQKGSEQGVVMPHYGSSFDHVAALRLALGTATTGSEFPVGQRRMRPGSGYCDGTSRSDRAGCRRSPSRIAAVHRASSSRSRGTLVGQAFFYLKAMISAIPVRPPAAAAAITKPRCTPARRA